MINEWTLELEYAKKAVEELKAENTRPRLNSDRYEYLRECNGHVLAGIDPSENDGHYQFLDTTNLDEAIDADMKRMAQR